MRNSTRAHLFVLLSVVLLIIIVRPIGINLQTLSKGEIYRFGIRPVDPVDLFKGRYVTLYFNVRTAPVQFTSDTVSLSGPLYAVLGNYENGLAQVEYLTTEYPKDRVSVKVKSSYRSKVIRKNGEDLSDQYYSFTFPFNRFYMNEKDAPIAERLYRGTERNETTYLEVAILGKNAIIKDLTINGILVQEAVDKERLKGD